MGVGESWPKEKVRPSQDFVQVEGPPEALQGVGVDAWPRSGSWQERR